MELPGPSVPSSVPPKMSTPPLKEGEGIASRFERRLVSIIQDMLDRQSRHIDAQFEAQRSTTIESHDTQVEALEMLLTEAAQARTTMENLTTRLEALETSHNRMVYTFEELLNAISRIPQDGRSRSFEPVSVFPGQLVEFKLFSCCISYSFHSF